MFTLLRWSHFANQGFCLGFWTKSKIRLRVWQSRKWSSPDGEVVLIWTTSCCSLFHDINCVHFLDACQQKVHSCTDQFREVSLHFPSFNLPQIISTNPASVITNFLWSAGRVIATKKEDSKNFSQVDSRRKIDCYCFDSNIS